MERHQQHKEYNDQLAKFEAKIEREKWPGDATFFAQQWPQVVGKPESVDKTKKQGISVSKPVCTRTTAAALCYIAECRNHNRNRDEELDQHRVNTDEVEYTERQCERVSYRKCCDQYDHLAPILNEVGTTKRDDKKNMVIARKVQDVLQAQREINPKILHNRRFVPVFPYKLSFHAQNYTIAYKR